MARVELAAAAVEDLENLIRTHSLPADTRPRVVRSLRSLEQFPNIGPPLAGRWKGFRFILGPWRWMILVYIVREADERVVVVTIQDGRSPFYSAGCRSSSEDLATAGARSSSGLEGPASHAGCGPRRS